MKNIKTSFSPWHTKQESFDSDHEQLGNLLFVQNLSSKKQSYQAAQKSGRKFSKMKTTQLQSQQKSKIVRSYSKTQSLAFPKKSQQNFNLTQGKFYKRPESGKKSQKTTRQTAHQMNQANQIFDDEKWKMLTLASNDKFRNENSEIRKYQKFVEQLKSRRSKVTVQKPFATINLQKMREKQLQLQNPFLSQTINSKVALKQVSVKNFIIQGHYTQKQVQPYHQCVKRRDINFALKQKFTSLRKNPNSNQNQPQSAVGMARKGILNQENINDRQNLFNVIKLQRNINNGLCQNKIR